MKPFNMRMFTSLFGLVVLLKLIKTTGSLPTAQKSFPDIKKLKPSLIRKIHLYSKQGHYIAILENGTVVARLTRDSPDTVLEMHSYSVNLKRIRRPNSDYWLAIDRRGRIRTRKRKRHDTVFYEINDKGWLWYENYHGYVLAFKKNYQPKHNVTEHDYHGKKTKFLIMDPK